MSGDGWLPIEAVEAAAFRIPTDGPESDGTLEWDHTILVVVRIRSGLHAGMGYTYAHEAAMRVAAGTLAQAITGRDAMDVEGCWRAMQRAVRNVGRSGIAACAISAVDTALWDLKARALDLPLATLFDPVREGVPVYGSGGFTNYDDARLSEQLEAWVERDGCRRVKIKIGTDPADDPRRIAVARGAAGNAELFVDANGAFSVRQALRLLDSCRDADVRWFEEPVTSDDPDGLRRVREADVSRTTDVAAGEYIFTLDDARHLLAKQAVDVLQADVTRCGGYTGFLKVAALCEAHHLELSGHCAPSLHLPVACAVPHLRHLEWFHDHVRIEQALFEGAPVIEDGLVHTEPSARGHGLALRLADAQPYHVDGELT